MPTWMMAEPTYDGVRLSLSESSRLFYQKEKPQIQCDHIGKVKLSNELIDIDVELTEVGANKVKVIKVVREITGLGLKEAKEVVDGAPKAVKEGASKAEAEDIKAKLEAEGAKVTLK
mgnify:CR=1 FL=1